MKNVDELLDTVHKSCDWTSDYKIGRGIGYNNSTQVSNWRRRVSMPNYEDLIAICDYSKIDLATAVRAVAYSRKYERPMKEAGFVDISLLSGLGAVSLVLVTGNAPTLMLALSSMPVNCILC